ncbi:hypothetical protein KIN20_023585 [Parelaphostrongylus tenuis]|uniref:Uncharacterized protein n=1 Tax=Parelaphostrongylus tenuis TaxID=148309 RepID=A0AAD5QXF2_PARTN|nr:hypothetical protein KIN20_023585 [Parelaphostrongylus tenuis]
MKTLMTQHSVVCSTSDKAVEFSSLRIKGCTRTVSAKLTPLMHTGCTGISRLQKKSSG